MPRKDPESRLQMMLDHTEKLAIEWAIEQVGSVHKAAELLGVSRPYLYTRINALNLRHLLPRKRTKAHVEKKAPAAPEPETVETEEADEPCIELPEQELSGTP
jgi:hypothetical protein